VACPVSRHTASGAREEVGEVPGRSRDTPRPSRPAPTPPHPLAWPSHRLLLLLRDRATPAFLCPFHVKYVYNCYGGTRYRTWLRHCATSRKVPGSRPDEMNPVFNLPNPSGPTRPLDFSHPVTDMTTRARKIMFQGSRARPVRRAYNVSAICEPTV
jgi:hypothetical protein